MLLVLPVAFVLDEVFDVVLASIADKLSDVIFIKSDNDWESIYLECFAGFFVFVIELTVESCNVVLAMIMLGHLLPRFPEHSTVATFLLVEGNEPCATGIMS